MSCCILCGRHVRQLGGQLGSEHIVGVQAKPRMSKSEVVDNDTGEGKSDSVRTSSGAFFDVGETPVCGTSAHLPTLCLASWPTSVLYAHCCLMRFVCCIHCCCRVRKFVAIV